MAGVHQKVRKKAPGSVWDRPHIRKLLEQPIDDPLDLSEITNDEAWQIIEEMAGDRPDLPPGEEFVRQVRPMLGESMMRRYEAHHG